MKKVISLLLALVMALSLLPAAVWAEGESAAAPAEEVSESFFDSSHPFTWNDGSYVWRFGWNGPDGSRGEWHLYAAPEGTSADSADGWTDCGAEATPFEHLTEGTLAYAAACAMRSAWEAYKGDEKVPPELMWLIDMMTYESVAYTDEDVKAAQEFMDSHRIGMDGGTATLVFPDGSADELLNAWYDTTPAVRAALQKVMHCELVSTGDLYNFTQLLHRTLKAADDQGGNSFTNSCQALWDSGFQAPENPNFVFPAGLVEGEDYTYTYNNATGELHVVLLPQFDKGNHWADAFHNMSADSNSLNLQIRMTAKGEYTRAKDFSFNGSPASVINESDHVDASYFNMDNGVRWMGGSVPVGTVNRIDGQATIAPTDAFNKHFIAVVWGDDSGTVLRKELVILTVEVREEFVVNTFYDVAKPIPADKLKNGFTFMSGVTGWEASFSDGKLELFPDNGIPTSGDPIELGRIRWDDMAPDGYHFKSYVRLNSGNGEETYSSIGVWTWPNANGRGVDELYEVTWYNDTGNTSILQNLAVYQYDKMPYYRYISKDGVTAAPVTSLGLDTAQLSSSGIGVTYDETTGCFHVSHSGWELPDASTLLNTRITPTPPEGAVYFSANHDDGNRDPRIMGKSEASDILASLESFEKYSVTDSNRVNERSLELVRTQVVHLPGIDVCLSGSSNHRGLTVAWWDADRNLIGMSYVYGQNDDFMNRTRLPSVETADKLDDLNTRGEVNAPALVGAEGMELICDRYPQTGSGMTQFFDLHLLNDQGGTKTVYIPYHCFGMTYADDVQGKSADELPTILVRHFDANYNFRNEIIGRCEPQGIVFETDSFSPFTVSVGGGQSGGDADGYGDNIGGYDRWGEGSAWNGDPLRYMVIKSLRNMDGRDRLELGVDWRYDKVGSIYNVGITPEVLTQIVNANKPLVIYNERELTLSPSTLSDMLQKLNVLNANRGAEDNKALLWFRYEYGNRDGENGQAFAFMTTVYLGGTRYRLPDGETYTFSIYFDCTDVTPYELYCPADPEDASSELVKQANPLSCVDGHNDDGHSWRQCSFTADHDGMFVIHPKGYQMQQSWPWWGVPTPPWTPSPDATTPNSVVPELRSLYASGFKFPVIGKDIHFVFPEQLKEWTEGCGDDWDYRFTADESKGRVAIKVNMGSRERWEDAVRNIETGGLDDGVFFRYYFGNSDNQLPMTYGFDWYGDYGGQSLADNTLYRGYHHNNSLHLATVNRQNAHNSTLTLNSQGEDWRIILAMSNSEGKVADAEAKYAFRLEILPCEDISFSLPTDNGTAVPSARLHPTVTHQDWMATVPADGSVFLRTVKDKTLNNAGSGQYGLIGELTVDAPEGYTLREWRNNCTGGSGGQFPVPLFRDDQVITLIWQKDNAPDLVEYVRVEPMNYLPGFYSLGDENAPSRAPSAAEFLSTAEQKKLSDNGITVTYDEKLGYFTTSVDASKLTDLSLLHQCVTLNAPKNAVYFKFTGEGQLGEDGAEIYLPYSYFDLTAEEGLALAAKGVRPLIRHYLNENCTEKESLLGEYTAAGVRIVTRSFSPFLIDANGCTVGDLNGDGAVDTLDMQALYENLSTGRTTEKLADNDDFRLLADCNGDGAVNILDYQKIYQDIKTA